MSKTLYLTSEISRKSAHGLIRDIHQVERESADRTIGPVRLIIDSPGGSSYHGLALINAIQSSIVPIHTYVIGTACSMAFLVLLSGEIRFAYKYSVGMIHQMRDALSGPVGVIKDDMKETNRVQKVLNEIVLSNTSITESLLQAKYERKEDWWMDPKTMLKYGVVNSIIT